MKQIVYMTSKFSGAGKTTAAKYLESIGYEYISIASYVQPYENEVDSPRLIHLAFCDLAVHIVTSNKRYFVFDNYNDFDTIAWFSSAKRMMYSEYIFYKVDITLPFKRHSCLDSRVMVYNDFGNIFRDSILSLTTHFHIVGAGPSGIHCALTLQKHGIPFVLYEMGKPLGEREKNGEDVPSGFGGAGLWNDGKVSWYPANAKVYEMPYIHEALRSVQQWIPRRKTVEGVDQVEGLVYKGYDVTHLTFEERYNLLSVWYMYLSSHLVWTKYDHVRVPRIVFAVGRLPVLNRLRLKSGRSEIGCRLELPASHVLWTRLQGKDPKYKMELDDGLVKTFCCCRNGEVLAYMHEGLELFSGHSEAVTEWSNIGINFVQHHDIELPTQSYRGDIHGLPNKILQRAIHQLMSLLGVENYSGARIYYPCMEGHGQYPNIGAGGRLQSSGGQKYVIGDATGIYRGLLPAMLAGVSVGEQISMEHMTLRSQKGGPGLHEVHLFVDADEQVVLDAVDAWNKERVSGKMVGEHVKPMKLCKLALMFYDGKGEVTVLQTAQYVVKNHLKDVLAYSEEQVAFMEARGIKVLRNKIEANAIGMKGIPQHENTTGKYFESHIRVQKEGDDVPLGEKELKDIEWVGEEVKKTFGVPCPTSYNKFKHPNGVYQRYLNLRFREQGLVQILKRIEEVKRMINEKGFVVPKVITEFVWYDTFPEMDIGWID